ncbi:hypothetical protein LUZ63_015744 [Rhynchospora breviuscula]|uniref:Uncharacterized protein n=1 Tax=Rhynchospora breviuscula TaxID=2022672 RepID=A0A9Q0HMP2_9POAL|nr:hypothetical protein LUZ63_015744 [Rhynchospora breviuscula]
MVTTAQFVIKEEIMMRKSSKLGEVVHHKSLAKGHTEKAATFLAHDLDWRFHGPCMCQHMSTFLTGETGPTKFNFVPRQVVNLGDGGWVVAEGWEWAMAKKLVVVPVVDERDMRCGRARVAGM